ncbi:hypothetical protein [uncultured Friedmanniella sp.]|uniref:hypothetical protein n=1 Tax=uncultured Friedmanniella sp. TaxID=335381 RepID=UPI0035C97861
MPILMVDAFLIEARIRTTSGTSTISATNRWRHDADGRLVAESTDGASVQHVYDAAGQMLSTLDAEGRETRHRYDGAGRRTAERDYRGQAREFLLNRSVGSGRHLRRGWRHPGRRRCRKQGRRQGTRRHHEARTR